MQSANQADIRIRNESRRSRSRRVSRISERSRKKSIETSTFVQNDFKVIPLNHDQRLDKEIEE